VLQLVIAALVSFELFFFLDYQLQAEEFKIHTGRPGYKGLVDLKQCGFGAIRGLDFEDPYYPADTLGIDLFPWLGGWVASKWPVWLTGHGFQFEADDHDWDGNYMPEHHFFWNGGCVGSPEEDIDAGNRWARYAYEGGPDVGDSNWVVKELGYDNTPVGGVYPWRYRNWFQLAIEYVTPESTYCRTDYHAVFWIKVNEDALDAELRLKVWGIGYSNRWVLLKEDTVYAEDLTGGSYDSLVVDFYKYYNEARDTDDVQFDTTQTQTDVVVWWNGKDQVWVDRIDVYDEWAWNSLTGVYDDSATAFIADHSDTNIKGFTLTDEPRPPQIAVNKYWANFIKGNDPSWQIPVYWASAFDYYQSLWFKNNPVDWHFYVNYITNKAETDTTSDYYTSPFERTLQEAMDSLIAYLDSRRPVAHGSSKKFAYTVASAKAWDGSITPVLRHPTQWEQEAVPWLAVAHGVNAIAYWEYCSYYEDCERYECKQDTTEPWFFYRDDTLWSAWVRGLTYADTTSNTLPDWRRDVCRFEPYWSVVRRVNKQLHTIGDLISDTTSWQAGFTCDVVPQSWVFSFKSDKYSADSAYVEIATFEYQDTSYFLLVNRRCLSTEAQGVRVELNLAGDQYFIIGLDSVGSGDNMYYAFIDTAYSAKLNGKIPFSTNLGPGQGKFFKIIAARRKI